MAGIMGKITRMVWYCLEHYPETRNSDRTLILYIYAEFYGVYNAPFNVVIEDTDLPSFETIRRARQKIQQERPELRADKAVEGVRIAKQEEYLEYAREEITNA